MKISVNLSEFFEKEIQEISRGDERILEANRILFSQIETVEEMYILIAGIMLSTRLSGEKYHMLLNILYMEVQRKMKEKEKCNERKSI